MDREHFREEVASAKALYQNRTSMLEKARQPTVVIGHINAGEGQEMESEK